MRIGINSGREATEITRRWRRLLRDPGLASAADAGCGAAPARRRRRRRLTPQDTPICSALPPI